MTEVNKLISTFLKYAKRIIRRVVTFSLLYAKELEVTFNKSKKVN